MSVVILSSSRLGPCKVSETPIWLGSSIFRWEPDLAIIPPQNLWLLKKENQYSCTFILEKSDSLSTSLLPYLDITFWRTSLIFSYLELNLRGQTLLGEIEFRLIHLLCDPINSFSFVILITSPVKALMLFLLKQKQILTSANYKYSPDFFLISTQYVYDLDMEG